MLITASELAYFKVRGKDVLDLFCRTAPKRLGPYHGNSCTAHQWSSTPSHNRQTAHRPTFWRLAKRPCHCLWQHKPVKFCVEKWH